MANLTEKQVQHVARLAALPISSKEITLFQAQLSGVVEYISIIAKAESRKQKAERRQVNVAREDIRDTRMLSQEDATSGGKDVHNGLFVVPAVFEEV